MQQTSVSEPKIKIGSWQGSIVDNDFEQNLAKVSRVLEQTKSLGLDFICFPECYLSGYSPEAIKMSSVTLDDPRLVKFIEQTRQYDTVILVGMSEKKDSLIYNTQLVLYEGKIIGTCHKTMLTWYDEEHFAKDLDNPVIEAKGIKFGVATCHSSSFVEPALYLRWKGARLLFTPHFNKIKPQDTENPNNLFVFSEHRKAVLNNQAALATLLKMVVVRSNVVVITPEGLGSGDSNIWGMTGQMVAEGSPFTECVVTAEFDKRIFLQEHQIDRREVPVELCEMIAQAAREYNRADYRS